MANAVLEALTQAATGSGDAAAADNTQQLGSDAIRRRAIAAAANPANGGSRQKALEEMNNYSYNSPAGFHSDLAYIDAIAPRETARTAPEQKDYFGLNPDKSLKLLGRFQPGQEPAGAQTYETMKLMADHRDAELAQKRFDETLAVDAKKIKNEADSQNMMKMKAYAGALASMMPGGVKRLIGPGGEFIGLDFSGNDQLSGAYRNSLNSAAEYLQKNHGDYNKAAVEALTDNHAFDKPQAAAPATPQAPAGGDGVIPQFVKSLMSRFTTQSAPAAPQAPAAPAKPSSAPPAALDYLSKHNDAATKKAFQDKYGYLPGN